LGGPPQAAFFLGPSKSQGRHGPKSRGGWQKALCRGLGPRVGFPESGPQPESTPGREGGQKISGKGTVGFPGLGYPRRDNGGALYPTGRPPGRLGNPGFNLRGKKGFSLEAQPIPVMRCAARPTGDRLFRPTLLKNNQFPRWGPSRAWQRAIDSSRGQKLFFRPNDPPRGIGGFENGPRAPGRPQNCLWCRGAGPIGRGAKGQWALGPRPIK